MSTRGQRASKALLLLATGFFLLNRITTGTLYYYISERFAFLTLLAVVGLAIVAVSYHLPVDNTATHDEHVHDDHTGDVQGESHVHHADPHTHAHNHAHHLSWRGALLVAIPIVLGLVVPPRPLGVSAMNTREVNLAREGSVMPAAVRAAAEKSATSRNILDWWTTFRGSQEMATAVGQEARVTGFVYHAEEYADDYFMVTRFVVSCCAADASVVALLVHWPDAPHLENDQWVEVTGVFEASALDNWQPPVLEATSVSLVEPPQQPYLYP